MHVRNTVYRIVSGYRDPNNFHEITVYRIVSGYRDPNNFHEIANYVTSMALQDLIFTQGVDSNVLHSHAEIRNFQANAPEQMLQYV